VLRVLAFAEQVQAYKLAIEQHRNFELRVPANVNLATAFLNNAEALLHSSSGSVGLAGSMDGLLALPGTQQQPSTAQQGPSMHGVRGWGSGAAADSCSTPQQAAAAAAAELSKQQWSEGCGNLAAVVAASAAAAERAHPPSEHQPRRRSIGGMRYIRFQFRSVSSVGSHMAPAVSVPPALVSVDRTNYYWGTVDVPNSSVHGGDVNDLQQSGYTFGILQAHGVSELVCPAGVSEWAGVV
jgi:hypothetical protein